MRTRVRQGGFSVVELLVVLTIFIVISSAIFGLLNSAQVRYRSEQRQLDALQGTRTGFDQLVRDIHRAGYPPLSSYQSPPAATLYAVPFVGMVSGSLNQSCTVNGGTTACSIPGPYDLVIETQDGTQVNWIYYQLRLPTPGSTVCTLYRAVSPKSLTGSPTGGTQVPLIEQVINTNSRTCDLTNGQAVFSYTCDNASPCNPQNIGQVYIQMQAIPSQPDAQTRQVAALTLQTVARRVNPPQ